MSLTPHSFMLGGGLDLVTPALALPQGRVIGSKNYEPVPAGYKRLHGFERYDGHPEPHKASYWVLKFDAGSVAIIKGQQVNGSISTATGQALIDAVVTSGAYGTSDAAGYLVLTGVTGAFQDNENLQVSSITKAVVSGIAISTGASNDTDHNAWLQGTIETARADIAIVPGSGAMRGVWRYKGKTYAFRDNAGAIACVMHVESATGWTICDLGHVIYFNAGTLGFKEEETLTGGISAATAIIKRVIVQSGDWSTNDAAGYLVLYSVTGTFQAETITSTSGSATSTGANTANTFQPGGHFEFRNNNFYGATNLKRMYGVDGVSKGFEWDGSVFVPIDTGMTVDTPNHLTIHKKHLFYSFRGGSVQHSGTGIQYSWTPLLGASEIGVGDDITGFLVYAGVLLVYSRNRLDVLYGTSSADWSMSTISEEAGAYEWTVQKVINPVHLDVNGIADFQSTQKFGDFKNGRLSYLIDPWIQREKKEGAKVTTSIRIKEKNQYRLFFDDGDAIVMDMSKKTPEFLVLVYGKVFRCACSVEDSDGTEYVFFGSDDGHVYRLDVGTSFDGVAMEYYIRLPFTHLGAPSHNKQFFGAIIEADAAPNTILKASAEFSYGSPDSQAQVEKTMTVAGSGGFWAEGYWAEFYWGAQAEGQAKADIDGAGTNISLAIAGSSTYEEPHTLHSITIFYSKRGLAKFGV